MPEELLDPPRALTPPRRSRPAPSHVHARVLFATTAFVGASLLFVVQPMIAKLLLPSYGGSATVWSTSSLFFQVVLLAAYLYAHTSVRRLGRRWQPRIHLPLLLVPLLVLPVALPGDAAPGDDTSPALWLLRTLVLMIGLPFAVVATTGPVLQKWFSWTDDRRADDPYFLFAASNLGSFTGLLAYPFLIEPTMTLDAQRQAWSTGFVVFVVMTSVCALVAMRAPAGPLVTGDAARPGPLGRRRMLTWGGLAFLPSALMLAMTAYISTDVAAIPLLWVIPLAIYLATFVAAFARRSREVPRHAIRASIALAFATTVLMLVGGAPIAMTISLNLVLLALVGFSAHARLAADRPTPAHLTTFYLVIATGGAAGGLLNGLVAPSVFDRVLEYPICLALVPAMFAGVSRLRDTWLTRRYHPAFLAFAIVVLGLLTFLAGALAISSTTQDGLLLTASVAGVVAAGWLLAGRPRHLTVVMLLAFGITQALANVDTIEHSRSFFGAYRVVSEPGRHVLVHGTTVHGVQLQDEPGQPTTYYASPGSVGDVFGEFGDRFREIGLVGLGTGTIAAYGQPGQRMTFFEIDSEIVKLASDPSLFSFLADSRADARAVVGDGRLKVAERAEGSFDLLVLDAFSSDSIPVHLLTREAFRMYADRLKPGGVLVVHISNRVFNLKPVVAAAAEDLGWLASEGHGDGSTPGSTLSNWIVLTSDGSVTRTLDALPHWSDLDRSGQVTWTDNYSSILSVLR